MEKIVTKKNVTAVENGKMSEIVAGEISLQD